MSVNVGTAVGYLDLDSSGFTSGLKTAQSEAESASDKMSTKLGKGMETIGSGFVTAGKSLTKNFTAPLAAAGTAAFKFASDFESAMAKVETIADPTKSSIESIKDDILSLSNETGASSTDLAESTYQAISAGVDTADSVKFVANASKLASAGFSDTTTAVDALTTIINAYGMSAEDATHIGDVLISTQNKGKTTVDELAGSMGKVIPTANSMGVSLEDLGTAYSYMTAGGIATAESTTYLNGMFNELGKAGTTVSDVLKEKTGKGFIELMDEGYSLRDTLDILQNYADDTGQSFNDLWSSQEAGKAGLSLLNTTTQDYNTTLQDFQTTQNDTEQAFETISDTTQYKLGVALQTGKNTLIEMGEAIKTMLVPYIEMGVEKLKNMYNWISSLSEEQKQSILKILGIIAAVGPLLLIFGTLIKKVSLLFSVFGKLKTGMTSVKAGFEVIKVALAGISAPVLIVIGVIAGLIAVIATLWKNNEDFRNSIIEIWAQIKDSIAGFIDGIKERLDKLGIDFGDITDLLWSIWEGFCNLLAPIIEGVFGTIADTLGTVFDVILGIFDFFVALFTGDWEGCWNAIKEIFGAIWEGIKNVFINIIDIIKGIFEAALDWFGTNWEECWDNIKQFFSDTWNNIKEFFLGMIDSIIEKTSAFIDDTVEFFKGLPASIKEHLDTAIENLKEWVLDMGEKGKEAVGSLIDNIIDAAKNIGEDVLSIGSDIVAGVWNGILGAKKWFKEKVSGFFSGIVDNVKSVLGIGSPSKVFANEIGYWLPAGVAEGFESALPDSMKSIQKNLDESVDNISTDDITLDVNDNIDNSIDNLKDTYGGLSTWFKSFKSELVDSTNSMVDCLNLLINTKSKFDAKAELNSQLNQIDTQVISPKSKSTNQNNNYPNNLSDIIDVTKGVNDTNNTKSQNSLSKGQQLIQNINITSPKALSEREIARQTKKATKLILEF